MGHDMTNNRITATVASYYAKTPEIIKLTALAFGKNSPLMSSRERRRQIERQARKEANRKKAARGGK